MITISVLRSGDVVHGIGGTEKLILPESPTVFVRSSQNLLNRLLFASWLVPECSIVYFVISINANLCRKKHLRKRFHCWWVHFLKVDNFTFLACTEPKKKQIMVATTSKWFPSLEGTNAKSSIRNVGDSRGVYVDVLKISGFFSKRIVEASNLSFWCALSSEIKFCIIASIRLSIRKGFATICISCKTDNSFFCTVQVE